MTENVEVYNAIKSDVLDAAGKIVEIEGFYYTPRELKLPPAEPQPSTVELQTLDGLVAFIKSGPDRLAVPDEDGDRLPLALHIAAPDLVALFGAIEGRHSKRDLYALAKMERLFGKTFAFDQFMDLERFTIGLLALFDETPDRAALIQLLGNVSDDTVRKWADDGYTQKVTVQAGVALLGEKAVPPFVVLKPFRTFREVEQPASRFLVRLKSGDGEQPTAALIEADGGAWKLEAMASIAAYLEAAELPESVTIIR